MIRSPEEIRIYENYTRSVRNRYAELNKESDNIKRDKIKHVKMI